MCYTLRLGFAIIMTYLMILDAVSSYPIYNGRDKMSIRTVMPPPIAMTTTMPTNQNTASQELRQENLKLALLLHFTLLASGSSHKKPVRCHRLLCSVALDFLHQGQEFVKIPGHRKRVHANQKPGQTGGKGLQPGISTGWSPPSGLYTRNNWDRITDRRLEPSPLRVINNRGVEIGVAGGLVEEARGGKNHINDLRSMFGVPWHVQH